MSRSNRADIGLPRERHASENPGELYYLCNVERNGMKHYQVTLINPKEPNDYYMVAFVTADNAIEATIKAQKSHEGLLAISAEFLCEE